MISSGFSILLYLFQQMRSKIKCVRPSGAFVITASCGSRKPTMRSITGCFFSPIWKKSIPNQAVYWFKSLYDTEKTPFCFAHRFTHGIIVGRHTKMLLSGLASRVEPKKHSLLYSHIFAPGKICLHDCAVYIYLLLLLVLYSFGMVKV